jgi:hypothetical protein
MASAAEGPPTRIGAEWSEAHPTDVDLSARAKRREHRVQAGEFGVSIGACTVAFC